MASEDRVYLGRKCRIWRIIGKSKNLGRVENRLKKLGVQDYKIRQNYENGEIIIEIPEDTTTDDVISNFTYKGNFEIKVEKYD